jgi:hypothetical protein
LGGKGIKKDEMFKYMGIERELLILTRNGEIVIKQWELGMPG